MKKSDSPAHVFYAEVLKILLVLQNEKPLSFREKKMLDRSRHLLVSEIAIAKGVRESEAEALIEIHWPDVIAMAGELMRRGELNQSEVMAIPQTQPQTIAA